MKTELPAAEQWPELLEPATEDPIMICMDHSRLDLASGLIRQLITHVVEKEQRTIRCLEVVLTGSEEIRRLNRAWKNADYDTDVLSFSLTHTSEIDGVVYVNLDFAEAHCQTYGASFTQEVGRYVVHGLLHLLGYRDDTVKASQCMRKKEDQYLQSAGFTDI